jgi:hypothetical protein
MDSYLYKQNTNPECLQLSELSEIICFKSGQIVVRLEDIQKYGRVEKLPDSRVGRLCSQV